MKNIFITFLCLLSMSISVYAIEPKQMKDSYFENMRESYMYSLQKLGYTEKDVDLFVNALKDKCYDLPMDKSAICVGQNFSEIYKKYILKTEL